MDAVSKKYVDSLLSGMNWREPDFKGGITENVRQEIQEETIRYNYPAPEPGGDLLAWIRKLDTEQLVQAYYDLHEKWTWESGDDIDRELLDCIELEIRFRGDPPTEGDVSYNTADNCAYVFDGENWSQVMGSIGMTDE